jgi:catechol 2,3-dioxygenase-like lactoylglutathione lyase family enzyme
MSITGLASLGPIFGLTLEESDFALELAFHGWAGAWMKQDHPVQPLMKALWEDRANLSDTQIFCVLHTVLTLAKNDWEAPILTGRTPDFAQEALANLRLEANAGPIQAIDHVQIAIPVGGERRAQPFYRDLLGLTEVPKPPVQAARGGAWYEAGAVRVHLGVEIDFRANDKAHVALVVDDVEALAERAKAAGFVVKQGDDLPGYMRAFLYDPFGNRIEILRGL